MKNSYFLMRTYFHLNQMDDYLKERKKLEESLFDIDWGKRILSIVV